VPRITSDEEALVIRTCLERLFKEKAGWKEGAYGELATDTDADAEPNSPQILLPVNYAPELHKTECFANALRVARQILGEQAAFVLDLAILKRAQSGEATPWHQDAAFRDPKFEYREVTIWVALRDVDESSGCLMFIPESHHGQVLDHRQANRDGKSIALKCTAPFDMKTTIKAQISMGGLYYPFSADPSSLNTERIWHAAARLYYDVRKRTGSRFNRGVLSVAREPVQRNADTPTQMDASWRSNRYSMASRAPGRSEQLEQAYLSRHSRL
jgi:hypothetical protein